MTEDIRHRAEKGARYRDALRDGMIDEALEQIAGQYSEAWAQCHDAAERESLWRFVQVVKKIGQHLHAVDAAGKLASHQISEARRLNR